TSLGRLKPPGEGVFLQPPRLYRYTDGQAPQAPAGDDLEQRPLQLQEDPPIIVVVPVAEPPPPPPPPPPVTTTTTTSTTLPPAVFGVKVKVRKLTLYGSFSVRRDIVLGLAALRRGHVVAQTRLHTFHPGKGQLSVKLKRKSWPTAIQFVTPDPKVTLADPGNPLTGTVTLTATASAFRGR